MIFLVLIHYFWTIIKGLGLIYFFQIKEYRFDRLASMTKEEGLLKFLYSFSIRLPKISTRNLLIVFIHLSVTSSLFLYSFEQRYLFSLLGFSLFLAPITSYLIVSLSIMITAIPSSIIRSWIRFQAVQKVKKSSTQFIGITGSYGKTSTKEYLAHILSKQFTVAKTPKNMNTDVGIALAINRTLTPATELFITELGAYRSGELNRAASYIPFSSIILTGLGNQHVDLYGSKDALIAEETSPIYNLQKNGTAYLNHNSIIENNIDISSILSVTFGSSDTADIYAKDIQASDHGTRAVVIYRGQTFHINTKLLGIHSIENLLPAIAVAFDLGMEKETIETQVNTLQPLQGKLSQIKGYNDAIVLHDGVNTNLNGFLAALDVMNLFSQKNKIVMTQGIIELGGEKRNSYEQILQKMSLAGITLFTTDKLFNTIKSDVQTMTFNDVDSMQKHLITIVNSDTLLLIEGVFAQPVLDTFISQHS